MRLEHRLEFRLAQVLLARLNLLELPQLELRQLIEQKIEENPVLEREPEERELPLPEDIDDWDKYPKSVDYNPTEEREMPVIAPKPTLKEYLLSQLRVTLKEPNLIKIGEYIIYSLNEDGYLPISTKEIAEALAKGSCGQVDQKSVELILEQIQEFDPIGVAARNLQECLLIQLRAKQRTSKNAIKIVEKFFKEFMDKNYKKIMKEMKISVSELEDAIQRIKSCRPKPGRIWEGEATYVLPDLVVEHNMDGWVVSLVEDWIPKIKLSDSYRQMLRNPAKLNAQEIGYIKKKWNEANLLIKGIEKRRETLTAIADYITKRGIDFLTHKTNFFKSITMQKVAAAIGRDTSTISRAIKGKWIQLPDGIFELKSFFSGRKIKSYAEILYKIKELVDKEDKACPLKDKEIMNILKKEKFDIARTTIVKYRAQLGIPAADKRRVSY
ncbi:MAG: RNA polymerase factor sigma-54 [bacterium]|nr:RNA polymerase factor sigma-54 [bacterium]